MKGTQGTQERERECVCVCSSFEDLCLTTALSQAVLCCDFHASCLRHLVHWNIRYDMLGGTTIRLGKPGKACFEQCLKELGRIGIDVTSTKRIAHVGDSLHHDIAGANGAGLPSVFIIGGVHAEALSIIPGTSPVHSSPPTCLFVHHTFTWRHDVVRCFASQCPTTSKVQRAYMCFEGATTTFCDLHSAAKCG